MSYIPNMYGLSMVCDPCARWAISWLSLFFHLSPISLIILHLFHLASSCLAWRGHGRHAYRLLSEHPQEQTCHLLVAKTLPYLLHINPLVDHIARPAFQPLKRTPRSTAICIYRISPYLRWSMQHADSCLVAWRHFQLERLHYLLQLHTDENGVYIWNMTWVQHDSRCS